MHISATGEAHSKVVYESLARYVSEVKIIRLTAKGDLWEWIEAGGTGNQPHAIVNTKAIETAAEPAEQPWNNVAEVDRPKSLLLEQLRNDTGNADRFLINFLNGTLDLRTGELALRSEAHFITKLVHHKYDPEAGCALFLGVVARMMGNYPDASEPELDHAERIVNYLQRTLEYSLTGTTEDKAVFVPLGKGYDGNTTMLSTLLLLLEEYAVQLQVDTLVARQESNNTQAELADLRSARFVMTSETEEGHRRDRTHCAGIVRRAQVGA